MNGSQFANFVEQLRRSRIYHDYELAFRKTTKLPLGLTSIGAEPEVQNVRGKYSNLFCTILASTNKICSVCPKMRSGLISPNTLDTQTMRCFANLVVTIIPVKLEDQAIAFMRTGQVFLRNPNAKTYKKLMDQLLRLGVKVDFDRLEEAYFNVPVVPPDSYYAMVRLLEIFAAHLALIADKIALQPNHGDSPLIERAKDYVESHYSGPISLEDIAGALNVSAYHFCRVFKMATGLTFVKYLNRVRIERAKVLLQKKIPPR
jgi:ligand-binding sensor protein